MADRVLEAFSILSGFTTETTNDSLIIKVEKDILIKKILATSHLYELGFEYTIDDKYVIFKIPIQRIGKEAVERLGLPI